MVDRPILFSAPMIKALLSGRKTQTRRLAWRRIGSKDRVPGGALVSTDAVVFLPTIWQRVKVGDRLWVRENFAYVGGGDPGLLLYGATWREDAVRAGCDLPLPDKPPKLRSCIHMPRKISRLTLQVTDVDIEHVQSITYICAKSEGVEFLRGIDDPRDEFRSLWETLHGQESWAANPEVVAMTFKVHAQNIDALREAA